jgi:hypothetical protein
VDSEGDGGRRVEGGDREGGNEWDERKPPFPPIPHPTTCNIRNSLPRRQLKYSLPMAPPATNFNIGAVTPCLHAGPIHRTARGCFLWALPSGGCANRCWRRHPGSQCEWETLEGGELLSACTILLVPPSLALSDPSCVCFESPDRFCSVL